ncbi:MAG: NAD(P)-binding domain-containing protein [Terriglobales bacterium]|jgi:thioredoxin reductase
MLNTAIIGAGPYGLSVAAHFRRQGIPFRIFGRPMDSWLNHMPKGMMLKSDGFASNIYDPEEAFTLEKFCAERGIKYAAAGLPVQLETFVAYGQAFRERMLPELEDKQVISLDRAPGGFVLGLEDGETVAAQRVVLAVGITHFEYVPSNLANLSPQFLSHSFRHADPGVFKGRNVVVIGGGASAIDLAALLHEAGADVQLVARQPELKFHSTPTGKPRSAWQQVRHPKSGLGPGLRSRFYADAPGLFHHLPEQFRLEIVEKSLGPSAGWFVKDKMAQVPCLLGYTPERAEVLDGNHEVRLHLRAADGSERKVVTGHIIAATGYKVNLDRLTFLNSEIRSRIKTAKGSPVLSSSFESSMPGIYFVGLAAANSFGPVMRFAFGAGFAARRLTETVAKALAQSPQSVRVPSVATTAK